MKRTDGNGSAAIRFQNWGKLDMHNKIKEPPPKRDPKKRTPPDKEALPEPEHVDPPPRDVREAPVPNPNGDSERLLA
jgi:hypothetical protein